MLLMASYGNPTSSKFCNVEEERIKSKNQEKKTYFPKYI
jgi:hypothetical protein